MWYVWEEVKDDSKFWPEQKMEEDAIYYDTEDNKDQREDEKG